MTTMHLDGDQALQFTRFSPFFCLFFNPFLIAMDVNDEKSLFDFKKMEATNEWNNKSFPPT